MTFMNFSNVEMKSVASMWVVPLGQTPGYLDPQSQEALHEVDVSGMTIVMPSGKASEERVQVEAIDWRD